MSTVSEKPVSRNEGIKEASRYLRGTIADGLARAITGAISEDDTQLTKFHGIYLQDDRDLRPERRKKKLEQAYSFMVRVRVPGGVCTPAQWLALDRIAERLRQRHAAPHHPPGLPVPRRDQEQPQAHHAGDQREPARHHRGLRRRQSQRHVQPEPAPVAGACRRRSSWRARSAIT